MTEGVDRPQGNGTVGGIQPEEEADDGDPEGEHDGERLDHGLDVDDVDAAAGQSGGDTEQAAGAGS